MNRPLPGLPHLRLEKPYVEVALPVPLFKLFHYEVPDRLDRQVRPGCRVLVPFGPKLLTGIALGRTSVTDVEQQKLKPVLEVLDDEALIDGPSLDLARWVARYYLAPLGETLRVFLPPGLAVSTVLMVQLTPAGHEVLRRRGADIAKRQRALMELIDARSTTTTQYLQRALKVKSVHAQLTSLQARGWIEMFRKQKTPRVRQKQVQAVVLTEKGRDYLNNRIADRKLTGKQRAALEYVAQFRPPLYASALRKSGVATASTLKALAARGVVEIYEKTIHRKPFQDEPYPAPSVVQLTEEQSRALDTIKASLQNRDRRPILLHGVTGSGKTEVYLRATSQVLEGGGQVLVLVPEIGLTPAALQLFRSRFREQVAILHSGLSEGERHDEWFRVKRGDAHVVVGTRSAVFAPLSRLRLIVIDEEHDASYKQDETPRYHAKDVALRRAEVDGALLILGSATPSMESFMQATESTEWVYLSLEKRVMERPLADAEIVDMQEEFLRHGPSHTLSSRLKRAIEGRLALGQQVVLLLNRRGFAPSLLCRSCGFVLRCDYCSVAMTYHQADRLMLCHHCNRVKDVPAACPACQGRYIFYVGEGTERLQTVVEKLFPTVKVSRLDSDVATRKGWYFRILKGFARGESKILIGTQMIAKGHDFPNVTLAGVVAADQALSMPDFRAAERTFQLLTQVAGRSGRGDVAGEVVIQTRFPNHYSLKFACQQDYGKFYRHEIEFRRSMGYPPYCFLANVIIKGPSLEKVVRRAKSIGDVLEGRRRQDKLQTIRILGPNPAPLERLKGSYRYQVLVKSTAREDLRQLLESVWEQLSVSRGDHANVTVDMDPLYLL